jgi:hypothetical protein
VLVELAGDRAREALPLVRPELPVGAPSIGDEVERQRQEVGDRVGVDREAGELVGRRLGEILEAGAVAPELERRQIGNGEAGWRPYGFGSPLEPSARNPARMSSRGVIERAAGPS